MNPNTPAPDRLLALLQAGRHAELEAQARVFLARRPGDGALWHVLGLSRLAQGRPDLARQALARAAGLLPRAAPAWADLGACQNALGERAAAADSFARSLALDPAQAAVWAHAGRNALEAGEFGRAEAHCRKALELQPDLAEAQYNLANALKGLGRDGEALDAFRTLRRLAAGVAEAQGAAALGLLELGRPQEAVEACRQALELKPGLVDAWVNLGGAFSRLGRYGEAESACRQAIGLNPNLAAAHSNLGNALWEQGRTEAAVAAYRRAVQIHPGFAEAHCNLGNALGNLDRPEEALAAYRRALELRPDWAEAGFGAGDALVRLGRAGEAAALLRGLAERMPEARAYTRLGAALEAAESREQALAAYRQAIALDPGFADAYYRQGNCLARMGRIAEAAAVYRSGMLALPDEAGMNSALIGTLNYDASATPAAMLAEARAYGARVAARVVPFAHHGGQADPDRRLRVGLVSGDLGEHPVGYFLENVLAALASANLELFAYETFKRKGKLNRRLRSIIPHWREASVSSLTDQALARRIRQDSVDILIDLAGHTAHNRLPVFAWKPAPVQVTWLGYLGSTGLQAIDYVLADAWALPTGEEDQFVETPWRLPDAYICFSPPDAAVPVGALPALENGYVTFGCFNNLAKMTERVVACWADVLRAVPESRLYLKARALGAAEVREQTLRRFEERGIGSGRLILEGQVARREDHFLSCHKVDIALDPFPYPGITTTVEGLWMGVPVLTLKGDRFIGHQGETILHSAGLPDWIAGSEDDYIAKAIAFAGDTQRLAALRAQLRQRVLASPLFDAPRFARNLEGALRGMWRAWCER